MRTKKLFIISIFLLTLFGKVNHSFALGAGTAAGVSLDLPNNFFVEGNAFFNYYGERVIDHTYGFKGNLGYKMFGASAYGLAGAQHIGFANDESKNFKDNNSPLYGFGVGYNFPLINVGVRLENIYFSLDRKDGRKENFSNLSLGVILVF